MTSGRKLPGGSVGWRVFSHLIGGCKPEWGRERGAANWREERSGGDLFVRFSIDGELNLVTKNQCRVLRRKIEIATQNLFRLPQTQE